MYLFTNQITAAIKLVVNIIMLMANKYPKCRIEREKEREREREGSITSLFEYK